MFLFLPGIVKILSHFHFIIEKEGLKSKYKKNVGRFVYSENFWINICEHVAPRLKTRSKKKDGEEEVSGCRRIDSLYRIEYF